MEQLLTTKLFIPKNRPDLISRPRLVDALYQGLSKKLILISAPAGYGKTTLVTTWLDQFSSPASPAVCWLSLDEDDSDPNLFFRYAAAAVRNLQGIGNTLSQLINTQQTFSEKTLVKTLLQDLSGVSEPFVLILDDYHLLDSAALDEALSMLVERMPPLMTMVLISRSDPGFSISRLRAQDELVEIRVSDLRFTQEEALDFMERSMKLNLPPQQINALEKRTEGWITGLKMAALSLQNRKDVDINRFVENFTGSHRYITDYLTDEVLAQIPPDIQSFLLTTAVLNQLNADLCDAVLPENSDLNSQNILEQLESGNTFLIALDDERHWFRYHHLFADLLRQKLPLEKVQAIQQKASQWSETNGRLSDAIDYALAAQAWDTAIPLLSKHGLSFVFQGKLNTLQHWIETIPREIMLVQPRLCLNYAWALVNQGKMDQVEPYLTAAEKTSQFSPEIRMVTAIIRANYGRSREQTELVKQEAALAIKFTPAENAMTRSAALLQLGAAEIFSNQADLKEAIRTLKDALILARHSGNMNSALLSGGYLGIGYLLQNDADAAAALLTEISTFAEQHHLSQSPLLVYVHLGFAYLAYLKKEWAQARRELTLVQNYAQFTGEKSAAYRGHLLSILVENSAGNQPEAQQGLTQAKEATKYLKNPDIPAQLINVEAIISSPSPNPLQTKILELLPLGVSLSFIHASLSPQDQRTQQGLIDPLSERELEILRCITNGLKNQEIADQLVISLNTVLYHTKNIYNKLGVNKRAQAILKARELNLL